MYNNRSNKFRNDIERNSSNVQMMSKIIFGVVGVLFVAIIAWWIFIGVVVVKSVDKIDEQGLKGIMTEIYCGKTSKDCALPF